MKKRISRLGAILLAVAMLLPYVMVVPAQAKGAGYDTLWSWDAADHDAVGNAAIMQNNVVPRENHEVIPSPVAENYGTYSNRNNTGTIVTESGTRTLTLFSMYNGINAKGGLPSVEASQIEDRERKTTESLTITMNDLGIATDAAAVALSHVLAVRVSISTEMSMLRDDDALYTVTTSAGNSWTVGMRNWTLLGIGTVGSSASLFYQITSEDLLAGRSLAEGETIETIVYRPFGYNTANARGGWFSLGEVEICGYNSKAVFEGRVAKSTTYTTVAEQTLRDIVLAEAKTVANAQWTIPEDLAGYTATPGYDAKNYAAGTVFRGPVYQRAKSNTSDTGLLLTTESFLDLVNSNNYKNRVVSGVTAAPGMDCSTFTYNALSRVSHLSAFTNSMYERDSSLVRLGDLVTPDDHPMYTDIELVDYAENTADEVYAAYAQLKPGDVVNTYCAEDLDIHSMLVYSAPNINSTNMSKSTVTFIEQTGDMLVNESAGYRANAQTSTYTFALLLDNEYVPYTLKEYTEGRVKNANVQFAVAPKTVGSYTGGVDIAVSSNYRLIELSATLSGENITPVTVSEYGIRSRYESQIMNTAALNEALANLTAGDYTLTITATTGPKTRVGAAMPVATKTVNFTVDGGHEAAHTSGTALTADTTALSAGTYYLSGDVTDMGNMTVSGNVVLCLNGYTLKAKSGLTGDFITVSSGKTLTICGGANGAGCIHGNGANATGIQANGTANVTLNSGAITGFSCTGAAGGVYLYGSSTMVMNGGAITNNTGKYGGAVQTATNAVFTMNGGIISGNVASDAGSALQGGGTIVMNGGTVSGNLAAAGKASSSAIYLNSSGRLAVNGGSIVDNQCGGIYFAGSAETSYLKINGGIITGNNMAGLEELADLYIKSTIPVDVCATTLGSWACGSTTPVMTLVSGTFGMDPAQTDWVQLHADSVSKAVGGYWVVDSALCDEHRDGVALSKTKLDSYLSDGAYILPSGTYYLTEDMTLSNQFVVDEGQDIVLCLNGWTINSTYINNSNTLDGLFRALGGKLTITDRASGGGVIDGNGIYKCMYISGGNVVLLGGTITNFNSANGGAVRFGASGTMTVEGGTITGNTSSNYGGAFQMGSGGNLVVNGGTISNNTATNGAVAYYPTGSNASITINGGTITGNSNSNASGTDIRSGTTNGTVSVTGGYVDATFYGNHISITGGTFTNEPTKWVAGGYVARQDKDGLWQVRLPGCEIHLEGTQLTNELLAGYVTDGVSQLPEGTYYLADDVTVSTKISVVGEVILCLNDHSLKVDSALTGDLFTVNDDCRLTVCGGPDGTGSVDGAGATSLRGFMVTGGMLVLNSGTLKNFDNYIVQVSKLTDVTGEFIMNGGKLTGGSTTGVSTQTGGAVRLAYATTFTMNGGEISGNTGKNGAAIYSTSPCKININDGAVIKDNSTTAMGGAIYLTGNCTVNITGGQFSGNSSASNGGAIALAGGGTVNIKGGTFSNNTATYGGALALTSTGTYNITGGTFTGNSSTKDGGAIHANSSATGAINISDGTFIANNSGAYGGAMRIGTASVAINITGGVYVNNTATSNNHTIYTNGDSVISGVTIVSSATSPTNTKCLIAGGKFALDPSSRLASSVVICYVRDINEIINVGGSSYVLTKEVVKGLADAGGHVDFGSSISASVLLGDLPSGTTLDDCTLTVTQNKWNANGGVDSVALDADIQSIDVGGGTSALALVANGISAKEMRDELTYVVTDAGGNEIFRKTTTLYDMFKQWYDESDDTFYRTMIADLVNYGAAAMTEFGYGTLTDQPLPGSATQPQWSATEGAGASAGYEGKVAFTLSLKEKIVLNVYVDGAVTGLADVKLDGQSYDKYTVESVEGEDGVSRIVFAELDVMEAKKPITFTVNLEGGESFSVTYSIKDYVVQTLDGAQSGVVKALQKYVESVSAYITENTREPDLKVLFIGNSATYYTDVPGDLTRLARNNGYKLQCDHVTQGSATLDMFAGSDATLNQKALSAIAQGYDVVFIQDNGGCIDSDDAKQTSIAAGQTLSTAIRASGADVGIYIRPPYYNEDEKLVIQQCEEFDKHFLAMADTVDADVISYVDRAFAIAVEETDYFLWVSKTNNHMNDLGGYLAVCVFYATLTDDSATHLGTDGLSAADAAVLQAIADRVVFNGENPFDTAANS